MIPVIDHYKSDWMGLSLHQPWATLIAQGVKTIETRRWRTHYRGHIVICSTKKRTGFPESTHPTGVALCTVRVLECRPFEPADVEAAQCDRYPGWAWVLGDLRVFRTPFPVRGSLGLFNLPAGVPA